MGTKLANLEAVTPADIERLLALGLVTTDDVLARASSKAQRARLADESGVPLAVLDQLVCTADLMRVVGIGEAHALLLAALETPTAAILGTREAAVLIKQMRRKNVELMLARSMPPESNLARWIDDAGKLPADVEI